MRLVIITQNEPFYLRENLDYLIRILPKHSQIVACVVSEVSPYGKNEGFIKKSKKTYEIFGLRFFVYYSIKFIFNKLKFRNSIFSLLQKNNIDAIVLKTKINSPESVNVIKSYNPDLLISILGNQIFKDPILSLAPKGCINLHTALLPKYRGLMPTFWVLNNNEKYTGVSVFFVDAGIDSGPIIVQRQIEIGNKTQAELIIETKRIGMEAIAVAVDLIYKNKVVLMENNVKDKTYFSFPTRADVMNFRNIGKRFF